MELGILLILKENNTTCYQKGTSLKLIILANEASQ